MPHPQRPSTLALALRAGLFALGLQAAGASTALAEPPAATRLAVNIPAGPLGYALSTYATRAGVLLSFDSALTEGKHSAGLQGSYTVQEGFAALLAGSGLEAVAEADGSFSLRRGREAALSPVTVTAQSLRPVTVSAAALGGIYTEHSASYGARVTNSATRLELSPRETPQTITVVTRQAMNDFALTTMDEVLEATSGVFVYSRGGNGNAYYSRGFEMQSQYDGVPNPWGISESNRNPSPDSAFLDHVEILQGASGLLSGAGQPGGTINMVRKAPTADFQASVEASAGSWENRRVVADVSSPLVASGAIRGRAVAVWQEKESSVDYEEDRKHAFYGVVEADLSDSTLLTASVQYQKNQGNTDYGLPMAADGSDLGFGRSTFFGVDWGRIQKENILYTLRLDQQLGGDWRLRAAYHRSETQVDNRGTYTYGTLNSATGDGLGLYWNQLERRFTSDSVDLYASGPVELFGRRHELVFGANGMDQRDRTRGLYGNAPINVYRYDPASIPRPSGNLAAVAWPDYNETRQHGVYAAARLDLADPLKLILGTRVSWYDSGSAEENGTVTPYAGVIFNLNDWSSVYASYSDIFTPQTSRSASGGTLKPVVGSNYEAGVKGEFYGGRLNVSAAVFRLEQTNLAKLDDSVPYNAGNACGGWCYTASGMIVSQGLDLGLNGRLLPGWELAGGYTYVRSEYVKGTQKGDPYRTDVPHHLLRVSTTYRFPASNWTVGGDLRVQSRIYSRGSTYEVEQGGVAIAGLMVKYRIDDKSDLSLSVNNLFDRKYYETVSNAQYGNFYGDPRNFSLTFRQGF